MAVSTVLSKMSESMKRSRFSEEQIVYAIRQAESGAPISDLCRQLRVSEATFHTWNKKYPHLGVSELRRLRQSGGRGESPPQTASG
jgi:transposase-like protein